MRKAVCRVFPPKGGSLLQAVPGHQNGVQQVAVDVQGACDFMTSVGSDNVITVLTTGPTLAVFFWQDVPDPGPADGRKENDRG